MQFAVNYSHPAARLLQEGTIRFDLFKCPDWPDMLAEAQQINPAYVHFPLFSGRLPEDTAAWDKIKRLRDASSTPFVNIHLAPHIDTLPGLPVDSTAPADIQRVVEQTVRDVEMLAHHFGMENVIVENAPHDDRPQYAIPRAALLPETMSRVIQQTGAGLLLDTAHARISALTFGMDTDAFIAALPVKSLRELHVTGVAWDDEHRRWSDHYAMTEADWQPVEHVVAHIQAGDWPVPRLVALEYGGVGGGFAQRSDPAVLSRDVPRLAALIRQITNTPKPSRAE